MLSTLFSCSGTKFEAIVVNVFVIFMQNFPFTVLTFRVTRSFCVINSCRQSLKDYYLVALFFTSWYLYITFFNLHNLQSSHNLLTKCFNCMQFKFFHSLNYAVNTFNVKTSKYKERIKLGHYVIAH